jgi:thioredoxin reductase/pSer/pThr/pTyr-binding forkhead associated (FHA) protein/ferredoxin
MAEKTTDSDYTTFGTLKVEGPTPLPDVLDLLVAGGGPAGTAAAVRCKEFGLACLVIDYDDLMKRIRDYPKEKLIKPGYGGGDKLQFPAGGPKLKLLHFDDIDKDEMVAQWKQRYKEFGISAKIGAELTGLKRVEDGTWEARAWSHRAGKEVFYRARNVLIAIGAGVPRRFDIPGNTEGLSFRLDDAAQYVGAPALVIGGGTSAAEAVIAISNAKATAEDASPIYWSYRGDRLPKVSKALSEVFFDAYIGNGNIRYLPLSEPVAVLPGPDKKDYLSVRVDRKEVVGRPAETVALEFPKEQVVACIGEDLPVKLLQGLGIKVPLVNNRPLMLVDPRGQTNLSGVFLVGDARGPKYLRCTDFEDSSTYEQITQKRNIKAAMVEAVEVVEYIASATGAVAARVEAVEPVAVIPPTPSEPSDARPEREGVQILSLQPDGTAEETFPSTKSTITIGRGSADVSFPDDVYMADHHATIREQDGGYVLEDTGAGSGVWIRAQGVEGRPLSHGDNIWIGSQILVVTAEGGRFGIAHYDGDGGYRATYPIGDRGIFVGRRADVTLDPNDLSLSRRHAQLRVDGGKLAVFDLGSTNGTFVRLTGATPLASGAEFRIGSKRFRFETFAPVAKLATTDVVVESPAEPAVRHPEAVEMPAAPAPAEPAAAAPAAPAAAPAGAGGVTIEHPEYPCSFDASAGEDVLHAYFANLKARFPDCKVSKKGEPSEHMDEPLGWECKVGLCGLCTVEILEGAENFLPPDPGSPEMNTIENKAFLDPDPKKYRLTCLAKVTGPVKLAIPS